MALSALAIGLADGCTRAKIHLHFLRGSHFDAHHRRRNARFKLLDVPFDRLRGTLELSLGNRILIDPLGAPPLFKLGRDGGRMSITVVRAT